jgi:O6-methylguanine-DNA--protein-cysteine methyltransferase
MQKRERAQSASDLKRDLEERGATPFQIKVYLATATISPGELKTYSDIARMAGHPNSARAVGSALKVNPFPGERIPCHRVIHKDGRVEGYLGSMDPSSKENIKKRALLCSEDNGQFFMGPKR